MIQSHLHYSWEIHIHNFTSHFGWDLTMIRWILILDQIDYLITRFRKLHQQFYDVSLTIQRLAFRNIHSNLQLWVGARLQIHHPFSTFQSPDVHKNDKSFQICCSLLRLLKFYKWHVLKSLIFFDLFILGFANNRRVSSNNCDVMIPPRLLSGKPLQCLKYWCSHLTFWTTPKLVVDFNMFRLQRWCKEESLRNADK